MLCGITQLRYSVCNHTHMHTRTQTHAHTDTHMWRSHGRISWGGQILLAGKAEKGEVASPLMTTYGENSKTERLILGFLKAEQNA